MKNVVIHEVGGKFLRTKGMLELTLDMGQSLAKTYPITLAIYKGEHEIPGEDRYVGIVNKGEAGFGIVCRYFPNNSSTPLNTSHLLTEKEVDNFLARKLYNS